METGRDSAIVDRVPLSLFASVVITAVPTVHGGQHLQLSCTSSSCASDCLLSCRRTSRSLSKSPTVVPRPNSTHLSLGGLAQKTARLHHVPQAILSLTLFRRRINLLYSCELLSLRFFLGQHACFPILIYLSLHSHHWLRVSHSTPDSLEPLRRSNAGSQNVAAAHSLTPAPQAYYWHLGSLLSSPALAQLYQTSSESVTNCNIHRSPGGFAKRHPNRPGSRRSLHKPHKPHKQLKYLRYPLTPACSAHRGTQHRQNFFLKK